MRWFRQADRKTVLNMIKLFSDDRERLLQILQEAKESGASREWGRLAGDVAQNVASTWHWLERHV